MQPLAEYTVTTTHFFFITKQNCGLARVDEAGSFQSDGLFYFYIHFIFLHITYKKNFPIFFKVYFKKVAEILRITAKKVLTVPKTVHFKKVSTLPITALKIFVPRYRVTFEPCGTAHYSYWSNSGRLYAHFSSRYFQVYSYF